MPQTLAHTPAAWRRMAVVQGWRVFKWAIFIFSAIYLYRIFNGGRFLEMVHTIADGLSTSSGLLLLSATLLLMPFNWGFEAYKWTLLVRKFQSITFFKAIQAILAGATVSLWVPNRTGEYLGRVLFVDSDNRVRGVLATLVGSLAQLTITLILGIGGLLFYTYPLLKPLLWTGEFALGIICLLLLLLAYFHINSIRKFIPRKKYLKPLRKYMVIYKQYHSRDMANMLLLSLIRYFIFSLQFYLLLLFFGVHITILHVAPTITLMFFVQTVIPSNGVSELSLRGLMTALFIPFTQNLYSVAAATYSLWFINLLAPGIAGLLMLLLARSKAKAL